MKKRMNYMCTKLLIVIGVLFSWTVNAIDQIKPNESPVGWQINHLKNGETRLEYIHGNKTHFYEVKLTGIDIDGESMILPKPVIFVHKNQVTKQWLPYLKETWIDSEGLIKWSFEINRPGFLSDSGKQITLKYDIDTDGEGGLTVGGDTSILFDVGVFGKTIHEFSNQKSEINISVFGSRCQNAVSIAGYPNKNKSVVFKLNEKSFPLFTQAYINRRIYSIDNSKYQNSSWNFAKFSEQNNIIQLVVPTEKMINDKWVDSINIFQQKISNQGSRSYVSMVKVTEQDIIGFIKTTGNWYQIMIDEISLSRLESDKKLGTHSLEEINHALLTLGNLAVNYFLGKSIVIQGEYLYAISNGSKVSKIFILKKESNQWIKQDPIVIQQKAVKLNPLEVSRVIEEVVVRNDLMVVAMQVTFNYVPLSSKDNQSIGEVRIYRRVNNQWLLEKTLVPEVGHSEDGFGEVVVVGNNMVLVSAYGFTQENNGSLDGLVHIFNYESGKWQIPVIINPPNHAKDRGYFDHTGFGGQLQLEGDDLYIKAGTQGYSSNNVNLSNSSVDCPYFDSFGVIYHYRKIENQWKFYHEIKSNDGANRIIGPMLANSSGLYFLSSRYVNSLPEIYMKHYSDGKINWQKKL